MVPNVVFDIGGVLADFRVMEFLADKGFDGQMSKRIVHAAVLSPAWERFERGEITEEEAIDGFAETDPEIREELFRAFSDCHGLLAARAFAIPLVRRLKEAGCGVYYLSNYSRKAFDDCTDTLAFLPYTDGGLLSFQMGMTKPDPGVFRLFLDTFGLEADTCVFVDDSETNVEAARDLGFRGIVYTSYDELLIALAKEGVTL